MRRSRFDDDSMVDELSTVGVSSDARALSEVERLYEENYERLYRIARLRFRLTSEDAESLINDVFVTLIHRFDQVREVRPWLIGAISNACRAHLRSSRRFERLPENDRETLLAQSETIDSVILVKELLARIDDRSANVLRLRFFEGFTVSEIAQRMSTTPGYAAKLLRKALARAEEVFMTEPTSAGKCNETRMGPLGPDRMHAEAEHASVGRSHGAAYALLRAPTPAPDKRVR